MYNNGNRHYVCIILLDNSMDVQWWFKVNCKCFVPHISTIIVSEWIVFQYSCIQMGLGLHTDAFIHWLLQRHSVDCYHWYLALLRLVLLQFFQILGTFWITCLDWSCNKVTICRSRIGIGELRSQINPKNVMQFIRGLFGYKG